MTQKELRQFCDKFLKGCIDLAPKKRFTTIAISMKTQEALNKLKQVKEDYEDVVNRLLQGSVDVYTEFVLIDNELPQLHTAVFQLGEDVDSLFYWDGKPPMRPITLKEANALMKQPKSNMTITKKDTERLIFHFNTKIPTNEEDMKLFNRLKTFFEEGQKKIEN